MCVCVCVQTQQITPQLALQVLLQFDKAINTALANRGSLNTYRFCDNVWTFVLNDVEFREVTELVKVDKVKIVACDGKSESTHNKTDKWQVQHTHMCACPSGSVLLVYVLLCFCASALLALFLF
uniref:Transcription initiation factor IIA subunit 2 n=1 Tax=Neolamprologus brichardi TaxID=32507 RepID=A0A3Q4G8J5_NEOBR